MKKGFYLAFILIVFPAIAQEGDAKIIQYMDFLQHRELVQKQDLVKFYAQLAPHRSNGQANPQASRPLRSTAQTQNITSDPIATGGSSK